MWSLGTLRTWRPLSPPLAASERTRAGTFDGATVFAQRVAEAANAADHHPDIDIRYPDRMFIALMTQAVDGLTGRNRIHLDVTVPHDQAEARVAAAIAAGGHLVSDTRARAFWILADVEGNEACICTWQDRG